jgi:hypothetical protein
LHVPFTDWPIVPSAQGEGHLIGLDASATAGFNTDENEHGGKFCFEAGLTALIGGCLKFGVALKK